jgi:cytochrome c oxidase subunit 3
MDYTNEIDPIVNEKMKKNLVYVGIFSIIMLFAGFTSAYIVMMGDSFWLKYPLPSGFWLSTGSIIASSLTFIFAIAAAKKDNQGLLKVFMALTVALGIAFMYFQVKGYNQLIDGGIHPINNHIIVTDGRYGDYFEVKYKGDFIEVDGNKFLISGKEMTNQQFEELRTYMNQFADIKGRDALVVENNNKDFEIYFENQPVQIKGKQLFKNDSTKMDYVDEMRLSYLAMNIADRRGDFFVRGEFGKDFHVYFKGKELEYKNRKLHYQGKELSNYLQIKATETADSATSLLYLISIVHLVHVFFAMFYLIKVSIHSFTGKFNSTNNLSLRLGAIFWHFLGILWIYLILFLVFIH